MYKHQMLYVQLRFFRCPAELKVSQIVTFQRFVCSFVCLFICHFTKKMPWPSLPVLNEPNGFYLLGFLRGYLPMISFTEHSGTEGSSVLLCTGGHVSCNCD